MSPIRTNHAWRSNTTNIITDKVKKYTIILYLRAMKLDSE